MLATMLPSVGFAALPEGVVIPEGTVIPEKVLYSQDFSDLTTETLKKEGLTYAINSAIGQNGFAEVKTDETTGNKYFELGKSVSGGMNFQYNFANYIGANTSFNVYFKLKPSVYSSPVEINFLSRYKLWRATANATDYYINHWDDGTDEPAFNTPEALEKAVKLGAISDFTEFKIEVDLETETTNLYIGGEKIFENIGRGKTNADKTKKLLYVIFNGSTLGDIGLDDVKITVNDYSDYISATYSGDENALSFDFENFTTGKMPSEETGKVFENCLAGFSYTEIPEVGATVRIRQEESGNKYLSINKETNNPGKTLVLFKKYMDLIPNLNDYAVEFDFKQNGTGSYNICDSYYLRSDGSINPYAGLCMNINYGTLQYFLGKGAEGTDSNGYIVKKSAYSKDEMTRLKMVIHKAEKTADLYIGGNLVAENIPSRENADYGMISIISNNSTKGELMIDNLSIYGVAKYTGEGSQQKASYNFEDYTTGRAVSGLAGFTYTEQPNFGGYAYIEEENGNKYYALKKTKNGGGGYNAINLLSTQNSDYNDYVTEFKFKLADDVKAGSSFNVYEAKSGGTGLTVSIAKNNSNIKIMKTGTEAYVSNDAAFNAGEFNTLKLVVHREAQTADVYVNDVLLMESVPARDTKGYGDLKITVNNGVVGTFMIDDIRTYNLEDKISSDKVRITEDKISGYKDYNVATILSALTIEEGTTVKIYNGETEVTEGEITEGMKLVAEAGTYKKVYTFTKADSVYKIVCKYNGYVTNGKFAAGTVEANLNVECNLVSTPVMFIMARYEGGKLVDIDQKQEVCTGSKEISLSLTVDEESVPKSIIKVFAFNGAGMITPLRDFVTLNPYNENDDAVVEAEFYPGYVTKAVTFSYDDGHKAYDEQLMAAFAEKNLPVTFNIIGNHVDRSYSLYNSLATDEEKDAAIAEFVKAYEGYEVANHSYTHPRIYVESADDPDYGSAYVTDEQAIADIEQGRIALNGKFGEGAVEGFAWPFRYSDRPAVQNYISENYIYSRDSSLSYSYEIPQDFLKWKFTVMDKSDSKYYDAFINDEDTDLKLFSVWGHAKDLISPDKTYPITLDEFKNGLLSRIDADRESLYIANNKTVVKYINAVRGVRAEGRNVINDSGVTVYLRVNGKNVEIAPNSTYTVQ